VIGVGHGFIGYLHIVIIVPSSKPYRAHKINRIEHRRRSFYNA